MPGTEDPNAHARSGESTKSNDGTDQPGDGKIVGELGFVRAEINPNLTTGVNAGLTGFDARIAGAGASINSRGIGLHTPLGSISLRNPFKK